MKITYRIRYVPSHGLPYKTDIYLDGVLREKNVRFGSMSRFGAHWVGHRVVRNAKKFGTYGETTICD